MFICHQSPIRLCWPLKADLTSRSTPRRNPSKRGTFPSTTVMTSSRTVIIIHADILSSYALCYLSRCTPYCLRNRGEIERGIRFQFITTVELDSFGSSDHSSEGNSGDGEEFHCVDSLCFCKFVLIKNLKFMAAYKGFQFRAKLPFRAFD